MMMYLVVMLVVALTTGTRGQANVVTNGETVISKSIKDSVKLSWNVEGIERDASLKLYKTKEGVDDNLIHIYPFSTNAKITGNVAETVKVIYTFEYNYTGNVDGKKTAIATLKIPELKYANEDVYILQYVFGGVKPTANVTLNVFGPVELVGEGLRQYYTSSGETFVASVLLTGKPKPDITWYFDGLSYNGTQTDESANTYRFNFALPQKLKPCERKLLTYKATGYASTNISGEANVTGAYNANYYQNLTSNMKANRNSTCLSISWETAPGLLCQVEQKLQLLDESNSSVATVDMMATGRYETCNVTFVHQYNSTRVVSFVRGNLNGTTSLLERKESNIVKINTIIPAIKLIISPNVTTGLKKFYIDKADKKLNVTIEVSAYPRPNISWSFDGKMYDGHIAEKDERTFRFSFVLPRNLKPCEKKLLRFMVLGPSGNATGSANVNGDFNHQNHHTHVKNIKSIRNENCTTISWDDGSIHNETLCRIKHAIMFMSTNATIEVTEDNYTVCNASALIPSGVDVNAKVITYVYGNLNGTETLLEKEESGTFKILKPLLPTTRPSPNTTQVKTSIVPSTSHHPKTTKGNSNEEKLKKEIEDKDDENKSLTAGIIVLAVILGILIITFIVGQTRETKTKFHEEYKG